MSFDTDPATRRRPDLQVAVRRASRRGPSRPARSAWALSLVGGLIWPATVLPAYLVAFLFWIGISLGCIGLTFLHHLVGGSWGLPSAGRSRPARR